MSSVLAQPNFEDAIAKIETRRTRSKLVFNEHFLAVKPLPGFRLEQQNVTVEDTANVVALDARQFEEQDDLVRLIEYVGDGFKDFERAFLRGSSRGVGARG